MDKRVESRGGLKAGIRKEGGGGRLLSQTR